MLRLSSVFKKKKMEVYYLLLFLNVFFQTVSSVPIYSMCSMTKGQSLWTKGSIDHIRSWLKSIVPLNQTSDVQVFGKFSEDLKVIEVATKENIRWKKFGKESCDGWLYKTSEGKLFKT